MDERRYQFHLYITRDTPAGWHTHRDVSTYRAALQEELTGILERAGLSRWVVAAGREWILSAASSRRGGTQRRADDGRATLNCSR
jgi:hypothetical protein